MFGKIHKIRHETKFSSRCRQIFFTVGCGGTSNGTYQTKQAGVRSFYSDVHLDMELKWIWITIPCATPKKSLNFFQCKISKNRDCCGHMSDPQSFIPPHHYQKYGFHQILVKNVYWQIFLQIPSKLLVLHPLPLKSDRNKIPLGGGVHPSTLYGIGLKVQNGWKLSFSAVLVKFLLKLTLKSSKSNSEARN